MHFCQPPGGDQNATADICSGWGLVLFGFLLGSKLHVALISNNQSDARRHIDCRHFELKHIRPLAPGTRTAVLQMFTHTCLCWLSPVAPSNGIRLYYSRCGTAANGAVLARH